MFKIEKNIPIPARSHGRNSKYSVMLEMEDGDSIVFRTGNEATYAQNFAKKKGIRTVRRAQSDGKIRVWREDRAAFYERQR
tara:strand:- start:240 stop:482 length:243 start_codon:yes stop_codon:yes gene_type:complete